MSGDTQCRKVCDQLIHGTKTQHINTDSRGAFNLDFCCGHDVGMSLNHELPFHACSNSLSICCSAGLGHGCPHPSSNRAWPRCSAWEESAHRAPSFESRYGHGGTGRQPVSPSFLPSWSSLPTLPAEGTT